MWEFILERAGYWAIIGLMMISLFIAFSSENLIKRLVGLSLFQTTIWLADPPFQLWTPTPPPRAVPCTSLWRKAA